MLPPCVLFRLKHLEVSQTEWASQHFRIVDSALQLSHVLLVKVSFNRHDASRALLEVNFLRTLIQFVLCVAAHFNDLGAARTIGQHLALQHIM